MGEAKSVKVSGPDREDQPSGWVGRAWARTCCLQRSVGQAILNRIDERSFVILSLYPDRTLTDFASPTHDAPRLATLLRTSSPTLFSGAVASLPSQHCHAFSSCTITGSKPL